MAKIPTIVKRRLQHAAASEQHPDPNLLSAFIEKSLASSERAEVTAHLARCSDCREVLSLAIPEPDSAANAAAINTGRTWLSWPAVRWLFAATCLAIVASTVLIYRPRPESPRLVALQSTAATAAQAGTSTTNAQPRATTSSASRTEERHHAVRRPHQPADLASSFAPDTAAEAKKASLAGESSSNPNAAASTTDAEVTAATPEIAELIPGRAKDATQEALNEQPAARSSGAGMFSNRASAISPAVASKSLGLPNFTPRWTLSSDGTLQRSLDSGRTWETILVSSKTSLRALAANGMDIWVGGSAGALYHSSDAGQHWVQVQPAMNGQPLTDDIIGVEFPDLQHGKITTASRHSWITEDAGQTWQEQ